MKHRPASGKLDHILARLPDLRAILRGSLLQRTIRHRQGCPKCDRGEGHPVWVLAIGYPGGLTRQVSLHPEQAPQVRRYLQNYRKLRALLEQICALNQSLLRPQRTQTPPRRRSRD